VASRHRTVDGLRVAIVNNQAPFVRGGAELLAEALASQLVEHGHAAEVIRLPFQWSSPDRIARHMLAARLIQIENADHVIALKFPAYYVEHDRKVLWLLHQFRQAYDMFGSQFHILPETPEGAALREMVQRWDDVHLRRARAIYTNSEVTSRRLKHFNGIDSTVLYPPLWDEEAYRCEEYGDFIFAGGRISGAKRQSLLVEAMTHTRTPVRLVVAGLPDEDADAKSLEALVDRHGLRARVILMARWIDEGEKCDLFSRALACAYIPYDEDSYGYVTLESFTSRKAVVTTDDAGGVLTLVADGETGLVVPPDAKALGAAFDALYRDRATAQRLGERANERMRELGIAWDTVIDRLLQ
jgi:glycosyltransferase involved in cell wall biosynthesis